MPTGLQPPPFWVPIQDRAGVVAPVWQAFLTQTQQVITASAPIDGAYLTARANPDLTSEVNLGALTTGMLKITVAAGIATPSTVAQAALTRTNDTNVTLTLGGTPTTALLAATSLTLGWSGTLGLARGGTAADLSATGGANQVLKQSTAGGAVTVGTLASTTLSDTANLARLDAANSFSVTANLFTNSAAMAQYVTVASTSNGQSASWRIAAKDSGGTARAIHLGLGLFADDAFSLSDGTTEWLRVAPSTGLVRLTKTVQRYNDLTTAGWGLPAIYGSARSTAQTAAVASVATYTVGAADGSFLVSANVLVTTSTTHNFTVTCAYTDESNTARTLTLPVSQLAGAVITAITNVTGAGPYQGLPVQIRCKAATAITIATTGTFTTVTYNVEGLIAQVA